jgi:spermidine/putrescine transport system substrate-binding protein
MREKDEPVKVLAPESRVGDVERSMTRRRLLGVGASGLAGLYLAGCGGSSGGGGSSSGASGSSGSLSGKPIEDKLLMANWAEYVDPKDVKAFTEKFGPKVTIEGYGSNDELVAKLAAGGSAYDIVVPSGGYIPELAQRKLIQPLDHKLIPNLKYLQPVFSKTKHDPGNKYSVVKDYGITSFYYRKDVVKDPPTTIKGWFEILPQYKGKKINFIEGSAETWSLFLIAAGHHGDSTNEDDYKDALKVAERAKPAITTINSTYIERLSQGQIDIGLGWSGDVFRAAQDAAKKGIEIGYTVPEGMGWYWTDDWCIAAAAKNPGAAHKWINYVLDPKVAGSEWNFVGYTVPVEGAEKYVPEKIATSPWLKIPDATLAGYDEGIITPQLQKLYSEYYTRFRNL